MSNELNWSLEANALRKELLKLSKPALIKLCKKRKVRRRDNDSKNDLIQKLLEANSKKRSRSRSRSKSRSRQRSKSPSSNAATASLQQSVSNEIRDAPAMLTPVSSQVTTDEQQQEQQPVDITLFIDQPPSKAAMNVPLPSREPGNELLTICIGQCGVYTGQAFVSNMMDEHKLDKSGAFTGDAQRSKDDALLLSKINTCFKQKYVSSGKFQKTCVYQPRAIFCDTDRSSIDQIRNSWMGSLLDDDAMIDGEYCNPSVLYPVAYGNIGMDIIYNVIDKIRKDVESHDSFQGIQVVHALSGGTGSGFTSLLLSKFVDEYPKKITMSYSFFSNESSYGSRGITAHHNPAFGVYNATLAIDQLLANAQLCHVVHNHELLRVLYNKCKCKASSFADMNFVSALLLSGVSSPFRFISEPATCSNMKKMHRQFAVFPQLKFMSLCHSPCFTSKGDEAQYNDHDVSIVTDSFWNDFSSIKPEDGKFMTTSTFYRSNSESAIKRMNSFIEVAQQKYADDFVTWVPHNVTSCYVRDGGFHAYKDIASITGTTVMSTTAIKGLFQRVSAMFAKQYRRKAYLNWYKAEGVEEEEFRDADKNIRDLVTEYQDKQDAVVDFCDGEDDDDDDDDEDSEDYDDTHDEEGSEEEEY